MEDTQNLFQSGSERKAVIDSLPLAVIITAPDLTIAYVNPVFNRLTGFTLAEVVGTRAPYPWWPPARHREYLEELAVVKTGRRHKSDWLFAAKDGHPFWIKASVAPVLQNGRVIYILACWTDISVNKAAEAALLAQLEDRPSGNSALPLA